MTDSLLQYGDGIRYGRYSPRAEKRVPRYALFEYEYKLTEHGMSHQQTEMQHFVIVHSIPRKVKQFNQ